MIGLNLISLQEFKKLEAMYITKIIPIAIDDYLFYCLPLGILG